MSLFKKYAKKITFRYAGNNMMNGIESTIGTFSLGADNKIYMYNGNQWELVADVIEPMETSMSPLESANEKEYRENVSPFLTYLWENILTRTFVKDDVERINKLLKGNNRAQSSRFNICG